MRIPERLSVWGCFSFNGLGPLAEIEGSLDSTKYLSILRRKAIPELKKLFPEDDGIFQQDLASCHTAARVLDYLDSKRIDVLAWPGNSPDMNPIENLWAHYKRLIRARNCTTKASLRKEAAAIWDSDPGFLDLCQKLITSMPNRVQMLIKNRGGHTKY